MESNFSKFWYSRILEFLLPVVGIYFFVRLYIDMDRPLRSDFGMFVWSALGMILLFILAFNHARTRWAFYVRRLGGFLVFLFCLYLALGQTDPLNSLFMPLYSLL